MAQLEVSSYSTGTVERGQRTVTLGLDAGSLPWKRCGFGQVSHFEPQFLHLEGILRLSDYENEERSRV